MREITINNAAKVGEFFAAIEAEQRAMPHMRATRQILEQVRRAGDKITCPDAVATICESAAKAVGL